MRPSDITYLEKLNELRLDLAHPRSRGMAYVFVEGESDIRLLRKFFNLGACKVECIPGGKSGLSQCLSDLASYPLIIGIRDADFDHLEERVPSPPLFLTDDHDMEMTIVRDDQTFAALMQEALVQDMAAFRNSVVQTLWDVSLLKWLNYRESLELNFRPSYYPLISCSDGRLSVAAYIDWVLAKSPDARDRSRDSILGKIEALRSRNPNPWQLTNGHDFFICASKYLREVHGNDHMNEEALHALARVAYTLDRFKRTTLYASLSGWCSTAGCSILN